MASGYSSPHIAYTRTIVILSTKQERVKLIISDRRRRKGEVTGDHLTWLRIHAPHVIYVADLKCSCNFGNFVNGLGKSIHKITNMAIRIVTHTINLQLLSAHSHICLTHESIPLITHR